MISSRRLIGVHVTSCWHRDTCGTTGRSEGGSSTSITVSSTSTEPPDILEVDALRMWREPEDGQAEMLDHLAAQESYVNIPVSLALISMPGVVLRKGDGPCIAMIPIHIWFHTYGSYAFGVIFWIYFETSWSSLLASLFRFACTAQIPAGHIRHCWSSCFRP